jgi:DNA repair photolyase
MDKKIIASDAKPPRSPIYVPRGRAYEYCDFAVTIYSGCPHGCTYCYVPTVLRWKAKDFHKNAIPRPGIVEAIRKQLKGMRNMGKRIMLCFTCDPYPCGCDSTVTREVVRLIKESGNHVKILTKGDETARRDFDILDSNDFFGVTWSGGEFCEPRSASHEIRRENLVAAKKRGITTWISCEPAIVPAAIFNAIKNLDFVDEYRIGKLNRIKSLIDWPRFGRKVESLCIQYGRHYYIKDDLRKAISQTQVNENEAKHE